MSKAPKFDYHLNKKEQESAMNIVPVNQAKIHIALRADITIEDKEISRGCVCVSEHFITIGKKRLMGGGFNLVRAIHYFDVTTLVTKNNYRIIVTTSDNTKIMIYTGEAMRLARTIIRNYILSTSMFPPSQRFSFKPHDSSLFPPFLPQISPAQAFQFTYNAYCSYYDADYNHEVVQFYHQNLVTTSGIVNLNQLPVSLMETNLRNPMNLAPFFNSLKYSSFIFGISCTNVTRPDLLTAISPLIRTNSNLVFLSIENCNIDRGLEEFAKAITENEDIKISYWDLSGNPFEDALPFMASLIEYPSPIFFLDLRNCNLTSEATSLLFDAIKGNENLWKLKYLLLGGAKMNKSAAKIFASHLKSLNEAGISSFLSLDFSDMGSGVSFILEALASYPQPLESLKIAGVKLKGSTLTALISIISRSETLRTLNISGTGLDVKGVLQVVKTIKKNKNITKISLDIGNLGLRGNHLKEVFKGLLTIENKLTTLKLGKNKLDISDVEFISSKLKDFHSLTSLNLNDNFHHSQKGIGKALVSLIHSKKLKSLAIRGCKSNGIEAEIVPVLATMATNESIVELDIRNNYFRDSGYDHLAKMIKENKALEKLKYDGGRPKKVESVLKILDAAQLSNKLIECKLPSDDLFKALVKERSKERARLEPIISQKQDKLYIKTLFNQVARSINSFMDLKGIPKLTNLIEDLTGQLAEGLQTVDVHHHSAVCNLIGLPLPFQSEKDKKDGEDDTGGSSTVVIKAGGADEYDAEEANKQVIECVDEDLSQLQTLKYNSLAVKRPSLSSANLRGALPPADLSASDYSYSSYSSSSKSVDNVQMPTINKKADDKEESSDYSSYSSYSYSSSSRSRSSSRSGLSVSGSSYT